MPAPGTLLLVNPPYAIGGAYYLAPQLGLAVAAAQLRAAGVSFTVVDLALDLAEGTLSPGGGLPHDAAIALASFGPAQVAFSVQCFNAPIVIAIADWLRRLIPNVEILAGGHHAAHLCVGPGPGSVDRILEDANLLGGASEWEGWNTLPDYNCFPESQRYMDASRQFSALVEVARGCPYACSFCSIPGRMGSRRRYKPLSTFAAEVDFWRARGNDDLHLVDDVLTVNRRALEPFLQCLEARRLTWTGMTRADLVDPDYLVRLAHAGCRGLLYGVESGDSTTRSSLNKRAGRYPDLADLVEWNVDAGLRSTFYFLFNLPGEPLTSVLRSVAEACRISVVDPGCARLNLPRLVPGTAMWAQTRGNAVLDLQTPYADTLRETVGDSCAEIIGLLEAQPDVFSTYYSAPGPLDAPTARAVARYAASLLANYPITASLLSAEGLFLIFFEQIAKNGPCDDLNGALFLFLERELPACRELPAVEAAQGTASVLKGRPPIDLHAARSAAINDQSMIRSAVQRALRLHRTAAAIKGPITEETCHG